MGADNSFYVKFIANEAPTFFGYIILVLAIWADDMTLTCRFINVFVTMNVHAQLKAVEKEAAGPKSIYIFQKDLCLYKFFLICA